MNPSQCMTAKVLRRSSVRAGPSNTAAVSFVYSPDGPKVLDGVSLRIEPGMRLGVLGESGAGKSTLLALLPRLYDLPEGPDSSGKSWGAVYFDGQDIRDLRLADLRRAVSLVPQQALLFEGTIRTNLLFANSAATEDQMHEALLIADFAATVASLPGGLDTPSVNAATRSRADSDSGWRWLVRLSHSRRSCCLTTAPALDAETEARIRAHSNSNCLAARA